MKTKKIAALNDFAKTDAVQKAAGDAKFFVVSSADILRKDADGHLVLNKDADVAIIRKEDLAETGYGEDSGADDESNQGMGEGMGESQWPEGEEAKAHVQALDKCRGMIMKGAGLADEDVYGDPAGGEGEQNDMDEAVKAIRAGDLAKAKAAVDKVDAKRSLRKSGGVSPDTFAKLLDEKLETFAKAFDAKLAAATGTKEVQPRQGATGEVVQKDAVSKGGDADGSDILKTIEGMREHIAALKQERTTFIEKANSKIALSPTEELRKDKVSPEIMRSETALTELLKEAAKRGIHA